MKKTMIAALVFIPATFLTSCTITGSNNASGYRDNVYTVGYYGYRPAWGNVYTDGWGNAGYWRGYRGWHGYRWHGARW